MDIKDLLGRKSSSVHSIADDATVGDCLKILNDKRIGILVVNDRCGHFSGLVSERDVLRSVSQDNFDSSGKLVREIMTPSEKVYSVQGNENLEKAMQLMTDNRVRHIPVMDGSNVIGIVSIGDLIKNLLEIVQFENEQLKKLISGGF